MANEFYIRLWRSNSHVEPPSLCRKQGFHPPREGAAEPLTTPGGVVSRRLQLHGSCKQALTTPGGVASSHLQPQEEL